MPVSRSLSLLFIRDVKNPKKDDSLIINPHPTSERMFSVVYRDYFNNIKNDIVCNEYEVLDFVDNVCNLLTADQDPFTNVQLTAPAFPTIIIRTPQLHNPAVRESITSVVKNTLRNWPTAEAISTRPVTRSVTRNSAQVHE